MKDSSIKNKNIKRFRWSVAGPYLTVTPGILFLIIIAAYPIIFLIRISFLKYDLLSTDRHFVGLYNFISVLTDQIFLQSLLTTLIFVFVTVTIEFFIGLLIASILNKELKAKRFYQMIFLLPIVVASTVVGLIWRFMLNYEYGIINYFFTLIHLPKLVWLANPILAPLSLILVDIWQWTPFMIIILLAGLQSLPTEVIEASVIDGCSGIQAWIYVKLPIIKNVIAIVLLLRIIDTFRIYDIVAMMTRGGPVYASYTLSWNIFTRGFQIFDFGKAAAMSLFMLAVVTLITTSILKITKFEIN